MVFSCFHLANNAPAAPSSHADDNDAADLASALSPLPQYPALTAGDVLSLQQTSIRGL